MIAGIAAVGTDPGGLRLGAAQPPEHVAGSVAVQLFQDGAHILGLLRHRHQYEKTATSYEAAVKLASFCYEEGRQEQPLQARSTSRRRSHRQR